MINGITFKIASLRLSKFFLNIPVRSTCANYPNYLGTELGRTVFKLRNKIKILSCVLAFSLTLEIWSFHVVDWQKTGKKCT